MRELSNSGAIVSRLTVLGRVPRQVAVVPLLREPTVRREDLIALVHVDDQMERHAEDHLQRHRRIGDGPFREGK